MQTPFFKRTVKRTALTAAMLAALTLACGPVQAQHGFRGGYHGYHGGYYRGGGWGPGPLWGGLGLGIGLGLGTYYYSRPDPVVIVDSGPPVYYTTPAPVPVAPQAAAAAVDPIFYPRNGQNAAQTEADRQACNRWATTQPSAMADASVFHRATLACMDGRGYTSR